MKSGPDVFADALVPGTPRSPGTSSFPGTLLFRGPCLPAPGLLIFPQFLHVYPDHRRPASWAPDAGFRRRPATALVEGQLVEYEPAPSVYLPPWSVSVEQDPRPHASSRARPKASQSRFVRAYLMRGDRRRAPSNWWHDPGTGHQAYRFVATRRAARLAASLPSRGRQPQGITPVRAALRAGTEDEDIGV